MRTRRAFDQTVRVPAGDVVEASGACSAEWRLERDGAWRIYRMVTHPAAAAR